MVSIAVVLALGAALLNAPRAWAIAPMQQRTDPALGTTLYDVVNLVTDPTLSVAPVNAGTGSIVRTEIDENLNVGYFCVLTAKHVVDDPNINRIGFGFWGDGTNGANKYNPVFPITNHFDGGATGGEDISVAVVRYGTPDAFFNTIAANTVGLWSPPAGNRAQTAAFVMANVASFTEIGYGLTATPHYTAGVQDGWTPVLPPPTGLGIQRFQNNFPTSAGDQGAAGAIVGWHPHNPSTPNTGEGSSFGGDSGGPYLLETKTTRTVKGLDDPQHEGMTLPDQIIQLFTDTIFAVHTFGNNNNPALYSDVYGAGAGQIANDNGGVILTPADIAWINGVPCPEPSSVVLAAIGLLGMVGYYWRRHRAAA
ncbi:MAG: PEP-CTERM sorting domain-containing protein [Planctomycetia bacterium]|nr:PEP-CTERM sorting domain-containing protein [Planctomycetia bacterium]